MKQFKYPYMIVGGTCLMIGMEGPDGRKLQKRLAWSLVKSQSTKLDMVTTTLEIMEHQMDEHIARGS